MNPQAFVRWSLMRALWSALEEVTKANYTRQPDRDPPYFEPSTWDGQRNASAPADR